MGRNSELVEMQTLHLNVFHDFKSAWKFIYGSPVPRVLKW